MARPIKFSSLYSAVTPTSEVTERVKVKGSGRKGVNRGLSKVNASVDTAYKVEMPLDYPACRRQSRECDGWQADSRDVWVQQRDFRK